MGGEFVVWGNSPVRCSLAHAGDHGGLRPTRELLIRAIHLLVGPRRLAKFGALVKAATLFKFHKALADRNYRLLFSSSANRRTSGPKGPSPELNAAIALGVMDVFTRRVVGFGVERATIDGVCACRMFNHATDDPPLPKHLSTDHDALSRFHRWLANLRDLEIEEVKSVPCTPVSHANMERLIGTIRREYLDPQALSRSVSNTYSSLTTTSPSTRPAVAETASKNSQAKNSTPAGHAPRSDVRPGDHVLLVAGFCAVDFFATGLGTAFAGCLTGAFRTGFAAAAFLMMFAALAASAWSPKPNTATNFLPCA